jgi:hypothetical protein
MGPTMQYHETRSPFKGDAYRGKKQTGKQILVFLGWGHAAERKGVRVRSHTEACFAENEITLSPPHRPPRVSLIHPTESLLGALELGDLVGAAKSGGGWGGGA